jgi:hypothetical protein
MFLSLKRIKESLIVEIRDGSNLLLAKCKLLLRYRLMHRRLFGDRNVRGVMGGLGFS